jgi:hypothetical protein
MKKYLIQPVFGAIALICMLSLPLSSVSVAKGLEGGGGDPSFCSWDQETMSCVEEFTGRGYCATYPPNCDGPIVTP